MLRDRLTTSLERDESGIWRARSSAAVSYPVGGQEDFYEIEESSFWFAHRNRCILSALRRFTGPDGFLDIGGGNGFVAAALVAAGFDVLVVEPGESGCRAARERRIEPVVCARFQDLDFEPESVPIAGLFDVLEHIEDDTHFLARIRRILRPDGRVVITVPAYPLLFSNDDHFAGHYRRYTERSLAAALNSAGFTTESCSYYFLPLLVPVFLFRTLPSKVCKRATRNKKKIAADHLGRGLPAQLLQRALDWEAEILARGRRLPLGASLLCIAKVSAAARQLPRP